MNPLSPDKILRNLEHGYFMTHEEQAEAAQYIRELQKMNAELLEALKEICDCPQFIDEATVPKAGIEAAPQQVIVNMSVALVRLRKARAAIAKAEVTK